MKTNPTISIIVPVYQVESYLRECLDSIIMQSFADWELLLVDDGSTDGGEFICDEYARLDSRIRVFHQNNQGLSAARNTGLDNARGQYYAMIDSDDVLATADYLMILFNALVENDADMSACGHLWFSDGARTPVVKNVCLETTIYTGKDFYLSKSLPRGRDYKDAQGNTVTKRYSPVGAHGKLYKRELFDSVRYPVGHILEDLAVAHRVYLLSERVAVLNEYLYAYRRRETGIYRSSKESLIAQEELFAYYDLLRFSQEIGDAEMIDYAGKKLRSVMRNKSV